MAERTTALAPAFLQAYPPPATRMTLTERQWPRGAQAHHLSVARTTERWTSLPPPHLPVPPHGVRAKSRLMQALVTELAAVGAAGASYRPASDDCFAPMPAAAQARTLPVGEPGVTGPTRWARRGAAPGRGPSFRPLQAPAGMGPGTVRSGNQGVVRFRFACDKPRRYAVDQLAGLSLPRSEWARAYDDQPRARGHRHRRALRALGATWLTIIFSLWPRHVPYREEQHLATMARQALRHPEKTIA